MDKMRFDVPFDGKLCFALPDGNFADDKPDGEAQEKLVGCAIYWNVLSQDLGGYRRIIKNKSLTIAPVVRLLAWHEDNHILSDTLQGSLVLTNNDTGLLFSVEPFDDLDPYIMGLIRKKLLRGLSIGIRNFAETWNKDESGALINEITGGEIFEISLTAYPVFETTNLDLIRQSLQETESNSNTDKLKLQQKQIKSEMMLTK